MSCPRLKPSEIIGHLADKSEKSQSAISVKLGRNKHFVAVYVSSGRVPNIALLTEIARTCGYEVHIIGHDEDITLDLE